MRWTTADVIYSFIFFFWGYEKIFLRERNATRRKCRVKIFTMSCFQMMPFYMRLATRFNCWDVLKKIDLGFCGSSRLRFPSETLLTTLRGLFSSEPESRHQTRIYCQKSTKESRNYRKNVEIHFTPAITPSN